MYLSRWRCHTIARYALFYLLADLCRTCGADFFILMDKQILLDAGFSGRFAWEVCDCMGNPAGKGVTDLTANDEYSLPAIPVPVSGIVTLKKIK